MGFFSSIFGGSSDTLNSLIPRYGQIGATQTNQGSSYQNQAGDFWSKVLSGDSSKVSQALAPEISSAKTRASQDQKTTAMFGGRSGGTAASNASSTDKLHSDLTNLIGSLTNSSASSLATLGSNMVSTGLGAYGAQEQADKERMANWQNSILGRGITGGVAAAESFGLGAAGGAAAGTGAGAGGMAALGLG